MMLPAPTVPDEKAKRVTTVRRFNRFYTRQIGVLNEGLFRSPFTLTQVRVLYELAYGGEQTAHDLRRALDLDAGYLSRILNGFEDQGLIARVRAPHDGRQSLLSLTERGQAIFTELDQASADEVQTLLDGLTEAEQIQLIGAMQKIERLLGGSNHRASYLLRPHRPGDMGWIVHRHGALYAQEYGWDESFEALVAEIVAQFIRTFDPARERCWIAEIEGEIVGAVFLVRQSDEVAKLRLLYVEPHARGQGLGRQLVDECLRTARAMGYRRLTLWTNDVLVAARRTYEAAGFELVEEERHHSFGHDLVGQTWSLEL